MSVLDAEQLEESLADVLATWWAAMTGEETYAHEWAKAAEASLRVGKQVS